MLVIKVTASLAYRELVCFSVANHAEVGTEGRFGVHRILLLGYGLAVPVNLCEFV